MLIEQHFRSNDHSFNQDAKLTVIDRIEIKCIGQYQKNDTSIPRLMDKMSQNIYPHWLLHQNTAFKIEWTDLGWHINT